MSTFSFSCFRPRLQNLSNSPNNTSTEVEQFDFRHVLTRHVKPRKRPQISKFLNDQSVNEGNQAVFECNVDGHPEPRISWLHDKKEIKESKFFRMTFNGRLTFNHFKHSSSICNFVSIVIWIPSHASFYRIRYTFMGRDGWRFLLYSFGLV